MDRTPASGRHVPKTTFGFLQGGQVRAIQSEDLFRLGKTIAIGVPGAFTPVCAEKHVPNFVANADKLRKSGYARLVCIAPNDPFVLDYWAKIISPKGEVQFLSDGNLDFSRALGAVTRVEKLFLGERTERFLLIVNNGRIEHFRVEPDVTSFTCTRAEDALAVAAEASKAADDGTDFFDI